jgi:tRNA 2-thiouridine synthesizing protein A
MTSQGKKPDKEINLRGKVCPMTFVYTKIALEEMHRGQTLLVILDYPPSFTNVPHSVKLQKLGTIVEEKQDGKIKRLLIERT